jgi:hypothetical protein
MTIDGAHYNELIEDLVRAVGELTAILDRPGAWERSKPGKWSGGQHAEHLALAMEVTLEAFADRLRERGDGTLPPVPGRGPLQSLFFRTIVRPGRIPRGGTAIEPTRPAALPERAVIEGRLRDDAERYRSMARGLDAAALDRLWIRNPFMTMLRWHYTLPEMVRMHAVHVRHHAAQIHELAEPAAAGSPRGA